MRHKIWISFSAIFVIVIAIIITVAMSIGGSPSSSALEGKDLYLNPESNSVRQRADWLEKNRSDLAKKIEPLIQPTATWFTEGKVDPYLEAKVLTEAAESNGKLPVLVAYNLPERDCGQYSSGGATNIDTYLTWLGSLAAGIGDRPALVILEPDAIAHAIEGCNGSKSAHDRFELLTEAVKILKRQPATKVYIDAGNASWIDNTETLANALKASGVDKADGFALNTANFETTKRSHGYGLAVSEKVGGKHFVIDTSRNGAGPPAGSGGESHESWCNPPTAKLGQAPTTEPNLNTVDALLWVKQPGDSDGKCRVGDKPAGAFMTSYVGQLLGIPL